MCSFTFLLSHFMTYAASFTLGKLFLEKKNIKNKKQKAKNKKTTKKNLKPRFEMEILTNLDFA